jgi:chromosome segregation ATPase
MNELLAEAVTAAEAMAAEADRSREVLADLLRGVAALSAGVEEGTRDAEERLEQLGGRLADAEQEISRDGALALARVQSAAAGAQRGQAGAASLIARVREELPSLRAEKERALQDLESDGEAARAALARYTEALHELENEAALQLERQRAQLAAVRAEGLALRQQAAARAEWLLDGLRSLEESTRQQLDQVADGYAAFGTALQARTEALVQAAHGLGETAAGELDQHVGHEPVEAARAAAAPFADALAALDRAAAATRAAHGRGFEEVGRRVRDTSRLLHALKTDLDAARHSLR